ncbi:hypothetical protein ACA30_05775 [Virgibacillus soli]|nr:hypothetical protein ACA30_05775 [Virgibacillus soli]
MEDKLDFKEIRNEMTPIPGFKSSEYLAHCPTGRIYSLVSDKWLLQGAKGTGDGNKYLITTLKNEHGQMVRMYLHEVIISSYMGISKSDYRSIGLEVNHISKNTKDCSIANLELVSSKGNKATKEHVVNKTRLTQEIAREIRDLFKEQKGRKVEWYAEMAKRYGVTTRSIQNVVLGATYKEDVA